MALSQQMSIVLPGGPKPGRPLGLLALSWPVHQLTGTSPPTGDWTGAQAADSEASPRARGRAEEPGAQVG